MDDKTADLRDLFVETTGTEGVTDEQTAARGSLSTDDAAAVDERLRNVVAEMTDRYAFVSDLPESDLRSVVRAFFDPETAAAGPESWSEDADATVASSLQADADAEVASSLQADADAVFHARMDLHLVADADRGSAPVPYEELREAVLEAATDADSGTDETPDDLDVTLAASLGDDGIDPETARRYRRIVEADLASRRVNHRYRDAFADLLTDADLSARLATDARRDGLEEAIEDLETDVSL